MNERTAIAGSAPQHDIGGHWLNADPQQRINVTLVLRRPSRPYDDSPPKTRAEAEQAMSAEPADLEAVRSFAQENGLDVVNENAAARTVHLEGTVKQMDAAFGVEIRTRHDAEGREYLSYDGPISVPQTIGDKVEGVLGLDQRPIARRRGV